MKRIVKLLLTVCIVTAALFAASVTAYAEDKNTVIVFEGSEQENGEVKIDVTVKENTGVYSMLLTLDYDESAMTLTGYEYGEALSSLEPMASGELSTRPFKFNYLGTDDENDTSTGRMMTLTFKVKEGVPDGKYTVTFTYERNKDVTYLNDGKIETKNLIIGGARIALKGSEIEEIEALEPKEPEEQGGNTALPWIIAGSVIGGAAVITAVTLLVVRKKKQKWIKV